jgi:5-methylcytosine-specific restriction endonuclease McrA
MATIWKIAPGNHAEDWPLFSRLGCIGIGWLDGQDFRRFKSESAILSALERYHGKSTAGNGTGAAEMIFSFANEIEIGHVIVANDAYNRAVGIGIVESEYLSPTSPDNPLRDDETTHRHHARLVDWVIKKPADIPGGRFFVQRTLAPLDDAKVATIKQAYRNAYPNDKTIATQLDRLLVGKRPPETPKASDVADVPPDRAATTTYRILRDTALARRVKVLHNYECQVCGHSIVLPDGSRYAEAHHIKPLGNPHGGLDIMGNVLCLCPNHHAECDLGVIKLSRAALRHADGHEVNKNFLDYHNRKIHRE